MDDAVKLERIGEVARLTLNRPERLNPLSPALLKRLAERLDEAAGARAIVITGAGRGFSSGAELTPDAMPRPDQAMGDVLIETYWPVIERIANAPVPVIAAVNGPAAGAGMSIAAACDIVLAARSASFLLAFVNIGLVPDAGVSWTLTRAIGRARTAAMMMTGETVTAEQAAAWGLVWRVCDDAALADDALALAQKLAAKPTLALGAIKRVLHAADAHDLAGTVRAEAGEQTRLGRSSDFMEGVSAFLQKRPARFEGR